MQLALEEFGQTLPRNVLQSAPRTPEYKQRSPRTCFYASLIAARLSLGSRMLPSEGHIAAQANRAGLLGEHGAETFSEHRDDQAAFVDKVLGLQIRFIDQKYDDDERIDALTRGLRDEGKPVLFGTYRHWVVLDGFKRTRKAGWIGMNPASGRRLEDTGEELYPPYIASRLVASGMPLVVIENSHEPAARFRPAHHSTARSIPAVQT